MHPSTKNSTTPFPHDTNNDNNNDNNNDTHNDTNTTTTDTNDTNTTYHDENNINTENNNTTSENNNNDNENNNTNNEHTTTHDENNNNATENNNNSNENNNNATHNTHDTNTIRTYTTDNEVIPADTPWGDSRPIIADDDLNTFRIYSQNVNGIIDRRGSGIDEAFHAVRSIGASIFTFQETHGDKLNLHTKGIIRRSTQKIWRDQNNFCSIATASSSSPVTTFTKAGGVMTGITGNLYGRIRSKIEDIYGRWCGFYLLGNDGKELFILTAYNVSQTERTGNDTLYNQQQAQYLLHYNTKGLKCNKEQYIDPKQRFIRDLKTLLTDVAASGHDIILTGDFNETLGESHDHLTLALLDIGLHDIIAIKHGFDTNIATYKRGPRRLDYIFVSRRIIDHVTACGYDRFDDILCSDHRASFLDLSLSGIFGRAIPILCSPSSRTIRGDHPSNITKYIKTLAKYIENHNLIQKATQLQQPYYYTKDAANHLDDLITKGMLLAESKCSTPYRLPWCKETHEIMTATNILRSYASSLRNRMDLSTSIDRKLASLKKTLTLPTSLGETNALLRTYQTQSRQLTKEKQAYKSKAYEEREQAFVEVHKDSMGHRTAQIIFRRGEDTKAMMKNLPKVKRSSGALTRIKVPIPREGTDLQYMDETDGPTIERLLLDRNIRHFRQASDTPLATKTCIEAIGFGATTPTAQQFLNGTADPSLLTTDIASQLLLREMKQSSEPIQVQLTADVMMQRYKKWNESTTTSVGSGRHLGHYAALHKPFKYIQPVTKSINPYDKKSKRAHKKQQTLSTEEEYELIDNMRTTIILLHHLMLQISIKNRHVYQRWLDVITQMIEKDPGNPLIHRLRVIQLYECDYNLLLGIYFRQLQQHIEDRSLLNDGCFGGRPNKRAIDPVLIDVTQTEIAIITRRPLVRFNNDMTSCFSTASCPTLPPSPSNPSACHQRSLPSWVNSSNSQDTISKQELVFPIPATHTQTQTQYSDKDKAA